MCPSASTATAVVQQEVPLAGFKARVRIMLRKLLLEEGLHPGHPLVAGYTTLLDKGTAHAELTQTMSQHSGTMSESEVRDLRIACFKGTDLIYSVACKPATSIDDT
ncbi:uncharacterized protein LOC142318175 [Lycorma delicatula]|uniref:uncharacterized protein LOC142318175 n=1 Tax=Lycorma delicatula TaxID=130591 RepID=UPI003F5199DA